MLYPVLLICSLVPAPACQDTAPQLSPVFRDSFETDTRADYRLGGAVSWKSAQLLLGEGASIERTFDGGARTRVDLRLGPLKLTEDRAAAEVRVELLLNGATTCYLRLRRERSETGSTDSLAFVDTGEQDGQAVEELVREAVLSQPLGPQILIEYRFGLVTVTSGNDRVLTAFVDNANAAVAGVRVTTTSRLPLDGLTVSTHKQNTRRFSDAEKEQLAQADTDNAELVRLYEAGKYRAAVAVGEKILKTRRAVLGKTHPGYSTSLINLAALYAGLGEFARAVPLCREAIAIDRAVLGEEHPKFAESLNNLAALNLQLGDPTKAKPLFVQASEIIRVAQGKSNPSYPTAIVNLGRVLDDLGEFEHAERLYLEALEIQEFVLGEDHVRCAGTLNSLASLYEHMGDYVRAEPLYQRSLAIRTSQLGEQHPASATSLSNLAGLYRQLGDYARAEPLYQRAVAIGESVLGEHHIEQATRLNNLAGLYMRMHRFAEAESLYRKALVITKSAVTERHPDYALSLNNLAVLYKNMGDFARAEPLYCEARDLRKALLGENHPDYANSLNNLTALYRDTGKHELAEQFGRQAVQLRKRLLGADHPRYATSLNNLAEVYSLTDQPARAEGILYEAVGVVRRHLNRTSIVQSERQQKLDQEQRRHHVDRWLKAALKSHTPAERILESVWQWKGAVTFRQQAYRRAGTTPELASTFASLRAATRRLSAMSGRIPRPPAPDASPAALESWKRRREQWDEQFDVLTREREDLQQQIAADSVEFRRLSDPLTVAAVRKLLPSETAFVDFLEYHQPVVNAAEPGRTDWHPRYLAFVVRPDQEPVIVELGNAVSLAETIRSFRAGLRGESGRSAPDKSSTATLRERLWDPLERHLDGVGTVIVSPDTELGTLSFAALPGAQPGSYLLEQYRFVSLPLAGMLRWLSDERHERPPAQRGLLVLGDVAYDTSVAGAADSDRNPRPAWERRSAPRGRDSRWRSVPGFQQELAIVRDQFEKTFGGGVTTLRGADATEAEFIQQAPGHYNLHLVTHGFFAAPEFGAMGSSVAESRSGPDLRRDLGASQVINQYLPSLLSGLVLAGANNEPSAESPEADGILTAAEIETIDLNAVDLVVLSACETGLGQTAGGEGLTGLQRAFHIAGARSVVASLWEVDDQATQQLMSRFYRNYWEKGHSKVDALRNAQLEILHDPRLTRGDVRRTTPSTVANTASRTNPRYWAAFVLSGDWR